MSSSEPAAEDVASVARVLDEAAAGSSALYELEAGILDHVRNVDADDSSPRAVLLRDAHVAFRFVLDVAPEKAEFLPEWIVADENHPPLPADQPQDVVARWRLIRESASNPMIKARLGHVALASGRVQGRDRVELAEAVIGDYLAFTASALPTEIEETTEAAVVLDRVDAVRAAAGIARQFGRVELRGAALDDIARQADELLSPGRRRSPGAVLRLTEYLVHHRDEGDRVDRLLERAADAYAMDVHNLDHVLEQQIARAGSNVPVRGQLYERRVQAWLDAADRADPLVGTMHRQTAVEHAEASGNPDLRKRAVAALQVGAHAEMDMVGLRAGIIRNESEIAHVLSPILEAPTWHDALDQWAVFGPPTGNAASNREFVAHQMAHSISALFSQTTFGGDNLPRFTATTDDERAEYLLARHELLNLEMSQYLSFEGLARIAKRHPLPTRDELTAYFGRHPIVGGRRASAIARALLRWWAGDFEGAAYTALPRVEALARDLLLALNAPLYRLQRESRPGQYPGLGFLLSALREAGVINESRYRYLYTLLANAAGWNARNELFHGFVDDLAPALSALILQAVAFLTVLPITLEQRAAGAGSDAVEADAQTDVGCASDDAAFGTPTDPSESVPRDRDA